MHNHSEEHLKRCKNLTDVIQSELEIQTPEHIPRSSLHSTSLQYSKGSSLNWDIKRLLSPREITWTLWRPRTLSSDKTSDNKSCFSFYVGIFYWKALKIISLTIFQGRL